MRLSIVLIFLICTGCFEVPERELTHLYKQFSPDSSKVVYSITLESSITFGSPISGLTILSPDDKFSREKVDLISGQILNWEGEDTLSLVRFISHDQQPKNLEPEKIEFNKVNDLTIKTSHYKLNAAERRMYNFDSLRIDEDSVFISGIDRTFGEVLPNSIGFRKGPITVWEAGDSIQLVTVTELRKSMDHTYYHPSGDTLINQPRIANRSYEFKPLKNISVNSIGNIGIYRNALSENQKADNKR